MNDGRRVVTVPYLAAGVTWDFGDRLRRGGTAQGVVGVDALLAADHIGLGGVLLTLRQWYQNREMFPSVTDFHHRFSGSPISSVRARLAELGFDIAACLASELCIVHCREFAHTANAPLLSAYPT